MGESGTGGIGAAGEQFTPVVFHAFLLVLSALWSCSIWSPPDRACIGSHVVCASVHLAGAIILTIFYKAAGASLALDRRSADFGRGARLRFTLWCGSDAILLSNWFSFLWPERILGAVLFVLVDRKAVRRALGWGVRRIDSRFLWGIAVLGPWIRGRVRTPGLSS